MKEAPCKPADVDLNQLRIFEKVASLNSFSAAARALGLPKSTVSRGVTKLEAQLGTRLFQRTTREVALTQAGSVLHERSRAILSQVNSTVGHVAGLGSTPRGLLKITTGIGFGVNVLSQLVPRFMAEFPTVDVAVELTSRPVDLIAEGVDIAVRLGPMPSSGLVSTRLASLRRYMCASPQYLASRGVPSTIEKLAGHDTVEMPGLDGKPRSWTATGVDGKSTKIPLHPRLTVNDPLTIYRMVLNGAGIGCLTGYLCVPDIHAGRLVRLFPHLAIPPNDVHLVFPSSKAVLPTVRAFVDFMKSNAAPGLTWPVDVLSDGRDVRGHDVATRRTGA